MACRKPSLPAPPGEGARVPTSYIAILAEYSLIRSLDNKQCVIIASAWDGEERRGEARRGEARRGEEPVTSSKTCAETVPLAKLSPPLGPTHPCALRVEFET